MDLFSSEIKLTLTESGTVCGWMKSSRFREILGLVWSASLFISLQDKCAMIWGNQGMPMARVRTMLGLGGEMRQNEGDQLGVGQCASRMKAERGRVGRMRKGSRGGSVSSNNLK